MDNKKSIILGIIIIIVVSIITTGCSLYKKLDATEFREHFGALGYTVDNTEEVEYEAKSYYVASKEDVPFKIVFYEFEKEVDAKKIYKNYKDNIANYITTNSNNSETTGAIRSKIVAVSTDEYIIISRVKNTLIFIAGTNDYKAEIDSLLEEVGY